MKAKLARVGDMLAVCLPDEMVRDCGFEDGQIVEVTPNACGVDIKSHEVGRRHVNGIPVYTMEELRADMDRLGPEAVPDPVEWGPDRGTEIIDDAYSRGEITPETLQARHVPRRG